MPHTTNRKAFRNADRAQPLFRLYTLLVAIELALKDELGVYEATHDIELLVKKHFGQQIPSTIQAQLTALQRSLGVLVCTFKNAAAPVVPAKYPGLRYVRLDADGFVGGSLARDLEEAVRHAEGLDRELRTAGVAP